MGGSDFTIATSTGPLTVEAALDKDLDVRPELANLQNAAQFQYGKLESRRPQIEQLISRHLGIPQSAFVLSPPSEWIRGGFNMCLPIEISGSRNSKLPRHAIIRFPIPFKVGEGFSPGSVDEKLRCEAATYLWLQSNCPVVPIPRLLGMGFPGTQSFTSIENESLWHRLVWQLRRAVTYLKGSTLQPYYSHHRAALTDLGYLLIEYVEDGKMLSSNWREHRHDQYRRGNLYHSLAKIMLSLASVPNPRIGSWSLDDSGTISLTNRPLTDLTLFWNRYQIPTDISRDQTYTSAEPFVQDLVTYQDNRMRHQPNSILSKNDGIFQLSALVGLRALLPQFWNQSSRSGPFVLTLPDLHQSNIFVDDDWNITRLIDFEFAPVRPIQMARVPSWLTNRGVDELTGSHLEEYKILYDEFVAILEAEETACQLANTYSQTLREEWNTGRLWYSMALNSINAFPLIFEQHLKPAFFDTLRQDKNGEPFMAVLRLWDENALDFIDKKREDMKQYETEVREIFAAAEAKERDRDAGEEDGEND